MHDPRTNDIGYDLRAEIKNKLKDCGYPVDFVELPGITMVKFDLPKGNLAISIKQASRHPMANIKALIEAAINQDTIKAGLPQPTAEREADFE